MFMIPIPQTINEPGYHCQQGAEGFGGGFLGFNEVKMGLVHK
jgi:hypothetical protein